MKVALINKNPAVSRLITLSLNKIGAQYVEFTTPDELDGFYDFAIIDSDVECEDASQYATKVMHLVPRGSEKSYEICLEKPFLPTEFIEIFERAKPQPQTNTESQNSSVAFHDEDTLGAASLSGGFEGFDLPDIGSLDDIESELAGADELDLSAELDIANSLDLSVPDDESSSISIDENAKLTGDVDGFGLDEISLGDAKIADESGLGDLDFDIGEISLDDKTADDALDEMSDSEISLDEALEATSKVQDDMTELDLGESLNEASVLLDEIETLGDDEILLAQSKDAFEPSEPVSELDDTDEIEQIKSALGEIETLENDESLALDEPLGIAGLDDLADVGDLDENLNELDGVDKASNNLEDNTQIDDLLADVDASVDELASLDGALDEGLKLDDADQNLSDAYELDDTLEVSKAEISSDLAELSDENLDEHDGVDKMPNDLEDGAQIDDLLTDVDVAPSADGSENFNDLDDELVVASKGAVSIKIDEISIDAPEGHDVSTADTISDIESGDETLSPDELALLAIASELEQEKEIEKVDAKPAQKQSSLDSIDAIDESEMLAAFGFAQGENLAKSAKAPQPSDEILKTELAQSITAHLRNSLEGSSIRDALKDLNIKINISFEDR